MLHHISFPVLNLENSAKIYDAALAALGFRRVWTVSDAIGYGLEAGKDKFAIKKMENVSAASEGFHLAFQAHSREGVQEFHQAAIQNGAIDNGAPGLRTHYGPRYYAAFIIDPDGHRVEAVYNG